MKNKSPIDNIVNDKEKKVKPKKKDTESITKNIFLSLLMLLIKRL